MDSHRATEVISLTEAKQRQVEQYIRSLIDGARTTTELLGQVEDRFHVGLPALQRLFYRMMSDGTVRLGPGLVPVRVD